MPGIIENLLTLIAAIVIAGLFLALPTMWLWNACMPDLFNLKELDLGHALYLNLLCGILFKGGRSGSSKIKK